MKTYTEAEGMAAIAIAKDMAPRAKETAIVRLFAIAMVFYRQDVGDRALDELELIIGKETVSAIMYISGFSIGGGGTNWEKLAGFPE